MSGTDPDSIFDDTNGDAVRPSGAAAAAAPAPSQAAAALDGLGSLLDASWKDLMLRGGMAVLFGIVAMFWPRTTVVALVLLWGIWALADGIGILWQAFHTRGNGSRAMAVLIGIIALAAGLIAILQPGLTAKVLVWLLGIWFIARAVVEVVTGFTAARGSARWLLLLSAAIDLALGLLLVLNPGSAAVGLSVFLGVLALVWGIAFIALAFVVRKAAGRTHEVAGTV